MSKSRLFEEKPDLHIKKKYQELYSELFIAMKKPKYEEMSAVLNALLMHDHKKFLVVINKLQNENPSLDYYIEDHRIQKLQSLYKIPFRRWVDGLFGDGKSIRRILNEKSQKASALVKREEEYKIICNAAGILNQAKHITSSNVKEIWICLKNAKLKLEDILDPFAKNDILAMYYCATISKLTEIFFKNTIEGLSFRSISINFSQMLAILVHGDEDMILEALIENGFTSSYSHLKDKHKHVFREATPNHFDDVVDFMEFKKSNTSSYRHDYFEVIPHFIKKCDEHQEMLVMEQFGPSEREMSEKEKEIIIEKYLHENHNIKKNISKNPKARDYALIYLDKHEPKKDHYAVASFSEYCEQFDRPSKKISLR